MDEIAGIIPRTRKAIELLGMDNNMAMRPISQWPPFIDYLYLERCLCVLSPGLFEAFIVGEVSEVAEIVDTYGLRLVHEFFNLIFDGVLNEYFFYDEAAR